MSSLSNYFKAFVTALFIVLVSACVSGPAQDVSVPEDPKKSDDAGFVDDQPAEPVPTDDAFFLKPATTGEIFRVLITDQNYSVRKVGQVASIQRPSDSRGDREQLKAYNEVSEEINYFDQVYEGVMDVRLNPHTGQIEQLMYVPGNTPKTWQASKLFQEDLTRFRFKFPQGIVQPTRFNVRFRWIIKQRPGVTREEIIRYLKSQKQ